MQFWGAKHQFAECCRPQVPLAAAQYKPKVPPRWVAIPREPWPLVLGVIGLSAGAPADHCGKPGTKLQLGLFKAQMKCKNQGGPREMTLKTKLWAGGSWGGDAHPRCYKPAWGCAMNQGLLPALRHTEPRQPSRRRQDREGHAGWGPAVRLAARHGSPRGWHRCGCKADPSLAGVSQLSKPGTGSSRPPLSAHPCLPGAACLRYPSHGNGPGCTATGSPTQQVPHPIFPAELQQQMPEGGLT